MKNNFNITLSVVLPIFNEAEIIERTIDTVVLKLENVGMTYELICVNDGSSDNSESILENMASRNESINVVHLSRNFGKEAAMLAGLDASVGEAVIVMDSDLQHSPNILPKMIKLWQEGYDVVECRKVQRGRENGLYRLFALMFNRAISGSLKSDMRGASDFKLLDRQVVEVLKQMPERGRFFRGLVNWIGFRTTQIPLRVEERVGGDSTWSTFGLVSYAFNNILAFTTKPLLWTAWLGVGTTCVGAVLGLQTAWNYFSGIAVSGFTTVILLIIIFSGIILASIGVVAIYLGNIVSEVKMRPIYVVRKTRLRNSGRDKD